MQKNWCHLYKQVAEEFNISEETVMEMEKYLLLGIREDISKASGRNILINKFINFKIPDGKIEKYIEKLEESHAKGNMTDFKFNKGIKTLLEVKEKRKNKEWENK